MFGWLTHVPPSPVLLHVGGLTIRWYGVILASALLCGILLAQRLAKRSGMNPDHILDLALLATVLAVIGARIVHVIDEWGYYQTHFGESWQLWRGGLAFHGVLFGGLLAVWLFSRWRRLSLIRLLDVTMPALVLGQIIGRWGNWFNQELYGKPSTLPWAIPIDADHRLPSVAGTTTFHPLFLYEAVGNLIILGLLLALWRFRGRRSGDIAGAYFILSPLLRFGLDYLRIGQPMIGPLTNAQVFSLVVMAAGLALLFTRRHRPVE